MKVLIAIESCRKNRHKQDWQRQTWLPELKQFDYKFFVGKDEKDAWQATALERDTEVLAVNDDYNSLPEKTLAIIKWAREHGYDYLLKLDDDVYARPERLQVPNGDYVGHAYGHPNYCSGAAYWLSATAMDACLSKWYRRSNNEDMCVGETLKFHHIYLTEDNRYKIGWRSTPKDEGENEFPHPDNDVITFHMYFPQFMVEMHANWNKRKQLVDVRHFYGLKKKNPWT